MGSKSPQVSTTESNPWEGQQPYLRDLMGQAQQLYRGGPQQYFPGQTVAPFSPQTQTGFDLLQQRALGGDPAMAGMGNYIANTTGQQTLDPNQIAQGGFGAMQGIPQGQNFMQQAGAGGPDLAGASQFAGGALNPYTSALQGATGYGGLGEASQFFGAGGALPAASQFAQESFAQSPEAFAQLGATAGGDYLGSNPYLDQVMGSASRGVTDAFTDEVLPGIAAQFGAAGRTGSGAQALTTGRAAEGVAEQLRGLAGDIYAPAYESERDRQIQASQGLGGLGMQAGGLAQGLGQSAADLYLGERGLGQQAMAQGGQLGLGGAQLANQMFGQGQDRMLSAGQGLGNLGMQGMGSLGDIYGQQAQNQFRAASLAPQFQGMQYGDIDQMMRIGGMNEDQAQRLIDADRQRFQFGQQSPYDALNQYSNVIYGLPAGYGTQSSSQPGGSRLSGALGGAAAGSALGPWGALGGGILGMFG